MKVSHSLFGYKGDRLRALTDLEVKTGDMDDAVQLVKELTQENAPRCGCEPRMKVRVDEMETHPSSIQGRSTLSVTYTQNSKSEGSEDNNRAEA